MSDTIATAGGAAWITDTLWPGARLAGGRVRGAAANLVAVPDAASPTQLLPASWTSVVAVARRPSDDRPWTKAARDAAGIAALITMSRVDARRRVTVVGDPAASLIAHLGREIGGETGASVRSAVVLCGPARANRKPVLQLLDGRGRTVAYAKVAWNELTRSLLAHERGALEHLAGRDLTGVQVPKVLAAGRFHDADFLVLGPVGVEHRAAPSEASTFALARAIEQTADEWRGTASASPFVRRVATAASELVRGRRVVAEMAAATDADALVLRAAHGDFVPWNTLTGSPAPAVWDWERYEQHAPIGYDRFHHLFQTAIFRQGVAVDASIARIDARLGDVVPELDVARARNHLDWYLADLLCRYEHDASPAPRSPLSSPPHTPSDDETAPNHPDVTDAPHPPVASNSAGLMARVDAMATVLEQRRSRR